MRSKQRCGEHPIETWAELKMVMRKRFAPIQRNRREEYISQRHVEQPSRRSTLEDERRVHIHVNKEDSHWR